MSAHPCSRRRLALLSGLAALLAFASPAPAATYSVGPGQPLSSIGQVPWATLGPGDLVLIHWRPDPYREKWVIDRQGTAAAPITVRGVPGTGGELPIISGDDAVTPAPLNFWNEERGVIKIGGSNVPDDTLPSYLVIENLDVRSAHPSYTFTDDSGVVRSYAINAAAIYVEKAAHLTIRGCTLSDSGNGLFIGVFDGLTEDVTIENNHILGNGIVGSGFEHNSYTAALGIVYQGNRFGPLRAGAGGNNLKDRSAGLVVRYNWIEGGNRQLDLVDGEDSLNVVDHPSYHQTFVYGNVLIEPDGAGNSQIVHYGGDSGDTSIYRKGMLYFFHNTLVSKRSGNTTLMRLSTDDEHADVRNNLLYVTATGDRLAMVDEDGVLDLSHNWLKPGWVATHGSLSAVINDDATSVQAASPGFTNEAGQDYRLVEGSLAIDAGTSLHPSVLASHQPTRQYTPHQSTIPRSSLGDPDLGAYETAPLLFTDGFESGDLSAWGTVVP